MVRILLILACLVLGVAIGLTLQSDTVIAILRQNLWWIAGVSVGLLATLGLGLWVGAMLTKHWLQKITGTSKDLGPQDLVQSTIAMAQNPESLSVERKTELAVNAGTWLINRAARQLYFNATVTVFGGLIGTTTIFLLYEQNQKIEAQNEKITLQADAAILQSLLLEGARRATLATEMTALFADLRKAPDPEKPACEGKPDEWFDCWHIPEDYDQPVFYLSEELHFRTRAFAKSRGAYVSGKIRPGSTSDSWPFSFEHPLKEQIDLEWLSPERGFLLELLASKRIAAHQFDFQRADLRNANLRDAYLSKINLQFSDMSYADFSGSVANGSSFRKAKIEQTVFVGASLKKSTFGYSDISGSNFSYATLTEASLGGRWIFAPNPEGGGGFSIGSAGGTYVDFSNANLSQARLQFASLDGANFTDADLSNTNLYGTVLSNASLTRSNLTGAFTAAIWLENANISEANFTNIKIDGGLLGSPITDNLWHWVDQPPIGLPAEIETKLCTFDQEQHHREYRPNSCISPIADE